MEGNEGWCFWQRVPNTQHWVQWEVIGDWGDDAAAPQYFGIGTQFWMFMYEDTLFTHAFDRYLVFGLLGVRFVFWATDCRPMEWIQEGNCLTLHSWDTTWEYVGAMEWFRRFGIPPESSLRD